jgi:hypothetical protein
MEIKKMLDVKMNELIECAPDPVGIGFLGERDGGGSTQSP